MSSGVVETRQNVLKMYRQMLRLAKTAKASDATKFQAEIRTRFRSNSKVGSVEEIAALLKSASSSLGYLRIVTPRQKSSSVEDRITKIVIGDSNPSGRKAVTNWHGQNLDPDSVRRHHAGLKRAGFMNNYHAKGVF